jgi:peptidoglycan/xylan/chitin deacetylase (PgdA/CDA1 family)
MASWPDGRRVAVCLSWDVDGESAQYVRFPDRARGQLSELHQRLYGPQVGVWKVLDLLDRYGLPATFYIPAYTARVHPEVVRAVVRAGHPLGLHGYMHETLDTLTPEEEERVLVRSQEVLGELAGYRPTLYRSPSWELNRHTPELLVRHGVRSDSSLMDDERPYLLETPAGPLVEIPIQWLLDDAEHWNHTRANRDKAIADPDAVFRLWAGEFEGYHQAGGCFVLTLHPFISGRWVYMRTLERLVRHILGFPGVWWATLEEITAWAERQPDLPRRTSPPPEPVGGVRP